MQSVDLYPHGNFVIHSHRSPWHTHWMLNSNSIAHKSHHNFIFLSKVFPAWETIHCMHYPSSFHNLLRSPLPCGHSPFRPRLRHPLHYYTVPRAILLSLPRFSRIGRILETLSSLTVEASLGLALPRRPSRWCYLNTILFQVIMTHHRVFMAQ